MAIGWEEHGIDSWHAFIIWTSIYEHLLCASYCDGSGNKKFQQSWSCFHISYFRLTFSHPNFFSWDSLPKVIIYFLLQGTDGINNSKYPWMA